MDFDWQEHWENGSDTEYRKYKQMSDTELIRELKTQNWGLYNRIWQVIQERKNKAFNKPLLTTLKELKGNGAFLERQHCTETLFYLLKLRNANLKNRLKGSSIDFDDLQFKTALKELELKIKELT